MLADSYSQSIAGVPENITYFYGDDDLESTIGTGFQVNFVNERLGIADMAHSKTPMTLRDRRDMDLSSIRYRTRLFG